jgi:superfamily II RNA helicase
LIDRVGAPGTLGPAEVLERFLAWVAALGLEPYPTQEQALLELLAGGHVFLDTPTGSGKSLVAVGLHFKALCEGRRSFYTAPVKALVNEKFFDLCGVFGPDRVGLMTGDATVNHEAPIICATTEVLANLALRRPASAAPPYAVMDEFHFYADRERGGAWQIPLITLPDTTFLVMSATLGDTSDLRQRLYAFSGREVVLVSSDVRPVPLDFEYRETPLHDTVEYLLAADKAPIYLVSFTQRQCAELAQSLTSIPLASRDDRERLAEVIRDARFDTPYGKDVRRFLGFGIGIHHAGLLPRYRRLVERLAQQGLLKVICGTDTLGVGVNIPIRTVLFTQLCKYDGQRMRILSARDFKQIAGRAGRKGFDERGSVVCQAPPRPVERRRRGHRPARAKPAKLSPRELLRWDRGTFNALVARPPENLVSRFRVTHGLLLTVLQREDQVDPSGGYRFLVELVGRSHTDRAAQRRLLVEAAALFRSLCDAGIVERVDAPAPGRPRLRVNTDLQTDFSLHQTLSLYLVEAVGALKTRRPDYALDVLTLVEAILEDPTPVLRQQERRAREQLLARLKAAGVPYEERLRQVEEVTHPQPRADFIRRTFEAFAARHPWVGQSDIRPKAIARELVERRLGLNEYVRAYRLQRHEGLLLRYLSQVYTTIEHSVPDAAKTPPVRALQGELRAQLEAVDSSLLDEWERLRRLEAPPNAGPAAATGSTAHDDVLIEERHDERP